MAAGTQISLNPLDTPLSATTRFLVELIAWVAGPWAAAEVSGSGWAAVPVLVVLLVLPSVFSTPGDKEQIVVATPGPIRLLIEVFLHMVATAGAWIAWPAIAAIVVTAVVAVAAVSGIPRARWLAAGGENHPA